MSLSSKAKCLSLLAIASLAIALPVTKSAEAATKLVEIPATEDFPGAIFEANCSYADGQTTVTGTLTLQERGVVELKSGNLSVSGTLPETSSTEVSDRSVKMTVSYFGTPRRVFVSGSVSGLTVDGSEQAIATYWSSDVRVKCDPFRFD